MRLSNKLSGWNTGLIAVGAVLFVGGLGLAVVLAVLLVMRIKASCLSLHNSAPHHLHIIILENEKVFELKCRGYRDGIKRKETR